MNLQKENIGREIKSFNCPICFTSFYPSLKEREPIAGDICVCSGCTEFLKFNVDGKMQLLSDTEFKMYDDDIKMQMYIRKAQIEILNKEK